MVAIACHVTFLTSLQIIFDHIVWNELSMKSIFDNTFNGIANIYFHNQIHQYSDDDKTAKRNMKALEHGQEIFTECIIILENIIMMIVVIVNFQGNALAVGLVTASFGLYLLGIGLKIVYYRYLYIWRDLFWTNLVKLPLELKKILNKRHQGKEENYSENSVMLMAEKETDC